MSGSDDNTIKIWDPATGSYMQTLQGHRNIRTYLLQDVKEYKENKEIKVKYAQ